MAKENQQKHKRSRGQRGLIFPGAMSAALAEELYDHAVRLRCQREFQAAADPLQQALDLRETSAQWKEWASLQPALGHLGEAGIRCPD
jgi:hypothetical protein